MFSRWVKLGRAVNKPTLFQFSKSSEHSIPWHRYKSPEEQREAILLYWQSVDRNWSDEKLFEEVKSQGMDPNTFTDPYGAKYFPDGYKPYSSDGTPNKKFR